MSADPGQAPGVDRDDEGAEHGAARARERVLRELGAGSSHPHFAPTRLAWARVLTRAPIVLAVIVLAAYIVGPILAKGLSNFSLADIPGLVLRLLNAIASAPSYLLIALAAAVSAALTAALTIRASLVPEHAEDPGSSSGSAVGLAVLCLLACGLCLAAGWAVSTPHIDILLRSILTAMLLLPAFALMAYLDLCASADANDTVGKVAGALRWTVISAIGLTAMLMASPIASSFASFIVEQSLAVSQALGLVALTNILQSVVAQKIEYFFAQVISTCLSIAIALYVSARAGSMARRISREAERTSAALLKQMLEREEDGEEERPSGCLGRLLGVLLFWRKRKMRTTDADPTAPITAPTEDWIGKLVTAAKRSGIELKHSWKEGEPLSARDSRLSPPIESHDLNWLFNGRPPSTDQRALLEAFQYRWSEHLRAIQDARYGGDRESHADLLVEAERGSEAQDAVAACAVFAVVARGQRVLVLVADDFARTAKVASLKERLARFGLDGMFTASELTRDSAATWCPPAGEPGLRDVGSPPDFCVATLSDYEQVFYSGAYSPDVVTALLQSLEVVFVDDLDELTNAEFVRVHLPFVIDKHRLLLRNDNRAMQLVITTRPIGRIDGHDRETGSARPSASAARIALAERFFGGDSGLNSRSDARLKGDEERSRNAHLCYLRSRATGKPARHWLEVSGNLCDSARRWLAKWLHRNERGKLCVVALDSRESVDSLRDRFGDPLRSTQCLLLQDIAGDSTTIAAARWVLVIGSPNADQLRTLYRALALSPRTELVFVTQDDPDGALERDQGEAESLVTLPIFPVADAPSLFVSHLRSAVPMLRSDLPTRREDFARFGLSWNEAEWRTYARALQPRMLQDNWLIELDGDLADVIRSDRTTWPAAFVRHRTGLIPHPVDIKAPIAQSLCLLPIGPSIQVGESTSVIDPLRYATWLTSRGLELGRTDLAYFQPILLDSTRQRFRAMNIRQTAEGTIIEASPMSSDGGDFVVPVRSPSLTLPARMEIDGPFSVRSLNASLFRLRETHEPCMLDERIVALATISDSHINAMQRQIQTIRFKVHVGVTVLAIGDSDTGEISEEMIRARYEGTWSVAAKSGEGPCSGPRSYWPSLTRVFNYAVSLAAPSLGKFMNAYAFRAPRGADGATILVIEPAATQGTALQSLRVILDDESLRRRFLDGMTEAITSDKRVREGSVVVGDQTEADEAERSSLERVRRLLETVPEIERHVPFAQGDLTGQIRVHHEGADWTTSPRTPAIPSDGAHVWSDINAERRSGWPAGARYGITLSLPSDAVEEARSKFGWDSATRSEDPVVLKQGWVRIAKRTDSIILVLPDYQLMSTAHADLLEAVARDLLGVAENSGATTLRDKVGVFASFVQSFKYEGSREGGLSDGRMRFGVQLPVVTLHDRSGDCDSLSILLVALLRAVGLVRAGLVLVEDPNGGHAMACVEIPAAAEDHVITCREGTFVMIECTGHWPVGEISKEYLGRHGTIDALGAR